MQIQISGLTASYYQQPILRLVDFILVEGMGLLDDLISFKDGEVVVDPFEPLKKTGKKKILKNLQKPLYMELRI